MNKIVVGADESEDAVAAVRWTLDEARLHRADVEVVVAATLLHDAPRSDHNERRSGDHRVPGWVAAALQSDVPMTSRVVCELSVPTLLDVGDDADLLVLGAGGPGGFDALIAGSRSARVAQLATAPVAVVRATGPVDGGRVVVGIDGSRRSNEALRWAANEARARDAELDVVHAWRPPTMTAPAAVAAIPDPSMLESAARLTLEAALAEPTLDGIRARGHLVHDVPAQALLATAQGAGLLVAGTRGLGRITGALLGSVSRRLIRHSPCPVVVV
jgi:nucleotide-binding universal stress UspA family protein